MNDKQRKLLIWIACIFLASLVYPPYVVRGYGPNSAAILQSGYAFIFELPDRAVVHASTLLVQWIGIALIGAVAYLIFNKKADGSEGGATGTEDRKVPD